MVYEGQYAEFKPAALEVRKKIKAKGHCSCIVKLKNQTGWFIQDCPTHLCPQKSKGGKLT